jgi:hypothetical protein
VTVDDGSWFTLTRLCVAAVWFYDPKDKTALCVDLAAVVIALPAAHSQCPRPFIPVPP